MKIEYEACDFCRKRLPNNSKKTKFFTFVNSISLELEYHTFFGTRVSNGKNDMKLCEKCWDSFVKTWRQFEKNNMPRS